ncbi:transcriptional repressor LexA [Sulfuriflexus mobilis]|uniref:transcriptional repressor LexA n=1 Tax=Sulfuriflexus mobilis TaxID=1811807 RepID=UPI000F84BAF8|nr:transcriptional repressor LexA [Sulfuriflexus mobilis]
MLTPRLQDTLDFIRGYLAQHGYAPLLSEIALGIGIHSKGVVHRYLQDLRRVGYIEILAGKHRGIRLIESESSHSLPLLGRIAAGQPIEAIPDHDRIDLAAFFIGENRFVLKVQGESMVEAGILDGDMVIVEQCDRASDGDIVVALIDREEATLKTLRHHGDGAVMLIPANEQMTPMIYPAERITIQGIVVGQLRSYK